MRLVLSGLLVSVWLIGCAPPRATTLSGEPICPDPSRPSAPARVLLKEGASRHGGTSLVVVVRAAGEARLPLSGAYVAVSADTTRRTFPPQDSLYVTNPQGIVVLDSLTQQRYQVRVRRIGYNALDQNVTVRSNSDTLLFALEETGFCLYP